MSLINTTIKPFKATAFKQGEFVEVSEADVAGKWSIFFFYPADFTFVCPTELGDLADYYDELQKLASTLAEHVAAAAPLGVDKDTVPADVVERERAIFVDQVRQSGKPEAMIDKIVNGKVEAYYKDVALLHQMWVREPKTPISQVVADAASAEDAKAALLAAYPEAGLQIAADLGTKVAKGEMTWG